MRDKEHILRKVLRTDIPGKYWAERGQGDVEKEDQQ